MKRFDLLKDADDKLWLINCVLRKNRLEAGLAIFFGGLPAFVLVYHSDSLEPIATVVIPNPHKIITSACEADMVLDLAD